MSLNPRMTVFESYLATIEPMEHHLIMQELLSSILDMVPELKPVVKWNQPMFTHHGTFIIAFSVSKKHFSVGTEGVEIPLFADEIAAAGYNASKMIFRIRWSDDIDYDLLSKIIRYNLQDKADCKTFWRK